jgi:hypothetical protein
MIGDRISSNLTHFCVCLVPQDGVTRASAIQSNPPSWGLDRIDDVTGRDYSYEYGYTGAGVHAYVLDTPMNNQTEFGARYASCTSFTTEACSVLATENHGSHVAGEYACDMNDCNVYKVPFHAHTHIHLIVLSFACPSRLLITLGPFAVLLSRPLSQSTVALSILIMT